MPQNPSGTTTTAIKTQTLSRPSSPSDIFWGYWNRNNPNVRNIRYFFMLGISNDVTNQLIARCLQNVGKELQEWPGVTFATSTDEGRALLGSPNGAVFAYFLMQHKAQLGHKTITRITVLRLESEDTNDFVDASLLFHVADVTPPPDDDDGDGSARKMRRRDKAQHGENSKHLIRSHAFEI